VEKSWYGTGSFQNFEFNYRKESDRSIDKRFVYIFIRSETKMDMQTRLTQFQTLSTYVSNGVPQIHLPGARACKVPPFVHEDAWAPLLG
jgi:hypothetical protein